MSVVFGWTPYIDYIASTYEYKDPRQMMYHCLSRCDDGSVTDIHVYFARHELMNVAVGMTLNIRSELPTSHFSPPPPKPRVTLLWNVTAIETYVLDGSH